MAIDLLEPKPEYDLGNGYKVHIASYLPDFYFNKDGEPSTKTRNPNNPAFVFQITAPDKPKGEKVSWRFRKQSKVLTTINTK